MRPPVLLLTALLVACANRPGGGDSGPSDGDDSPAPASDGDAAGDGADTPSATDDAPDPSADAVADVLEVEVSGSPGDYTFAVTLRSPDTGCERYADWWEVVDAEGALVYRRILAHSHVDEQPFTRSGGPVPVSADAELWLRAHMHGEGTLPDGYGGQVLRGRVQDGFSPADATALAPLHQVDPLPESCAF